MGRDISKLVTAGLVNETTKKPKVSTGFACRLVMMVAAIALGTHCIRPIESSS